MSGVMVIRELLLAFAPLTDALAEVLPDLPAEGQIIGDILPAGTRLPALAVEHISGVSHKPLCAHPVTRVKELVQVTVHAQDATDRIRFAGLVKRACANRIGDFAGVTAVSVTTEGQGPDLTAEGGIKTRSHDFGVSFNEPT
jgi:hypothetical protein